MPLSLLKNRTDIHVHAAVMPDAPGEGNIIKADRWKRLFYGYLKWRLGIKRSDPDPNTTYMDILADKVRESKSIDRAVVFGLDGVYDDSGRLDTERTSFMITNKYVHDATQPYEELLYAASINPRRADAIEELVKSREYGAVLVKVLPNVQDFNPSDEAFLPFYEKLVDLGMPLIVHSGFEFALPVRDQTLGDPARVKMALEAGVTVVLAHGGSTGVVYPERFVDTLKILALQYPNFYMDTSALTLPTRFGMVSHIRRSPTLSQKLIFGTDFPLPVYAFPFLFSIPPKKMLEIVLTRNPFDKQALIMKATGLGSCI